MENKEIDEKSLEAMALSYRMEDIGLISIVRDGKTVSFEWKEEEADSIEGHISEEECANRYIAISTVLDKEEIENILEEAGKKAKMEEML